MAKIKINFNILNHADDCKQSLFVWVGIPADSLGSIINNKLKILEKAGISEKY
jgi:hypothetical protein